MSNPFQSKSTAHEAAFELTIAAIAKTDISSLYGSGTAEEKGAKVAKFINKIFDDVLANLEAKK